MKILIPIPSTDFDPSEAALVWKILRSAGHSITFSTPDGSPGQADARMLHGTGLGPFRKLLMADDRALAAYSEMEKSEEFKTPLPWAQANAENFQALFLPGGHAPGMKVYLESKILQKLVAEMFRKKPVGAICHGVVLAARSKNDQGQSILRGVRTTALLQTQELMAWALTMAWLGHYYRTYPETVEYEVVGNLATPEQFIRGPLPIRRDSPDNLAAGFACIDGNYVSGRWPGDAHRFGTEFVRILAG